MARAEDARYPPAPSMEISSTTSQDGGHTVADAVEPPGGAPHSLATDPGRCAKRLLGDLLALNLELAGQLQLERLGDAGTAGFLTKMIAQHERAAALIRRELARPASARSVKRR